MPSNSQPARAPRCSPPAPPAACADEGGEEHEVAVVTRLAVEIAFEKAATMPLMAAITVAKPREAGSIRRSPKTPLPAENQVPKERTRAEVSAPSLQQQGGTAGEERQRHRPAGEAAARPLGSGRLMSEALPSRARRSAGPRGPRARAGLPDRRRSRRGSALRRRAPTVTNGRCPASSVAVGRATAACSKGCVRMATQPPSTCSCTAAERGPERRSGSSDCGQSPEHRIALQDGPQERRLGLHHQQSRTGSWISTICQGRPVRRSLSIPRHAEQGGDVVRELGAATVAPRIDVAEVVFEADPRHHRHHRGEQPGEKSAVVVVAQRVVGHQERAPVEEQPASAAAPTTTQTRWCVAVLGRGWARSAERVCTCERAMAGEYQVGTASKRRSARGVALGASSSTSAPGEVGAARRASSQSL